jgi:alpha-N-arabinofuranosidase
MMKKQSIVPVLIFLVGMMNSLTAQQVLDIRTDKPLASISPSMWGIFFEDINFATDGGCMPNW